MTMRVTAVAVSLAIVALLTACSSELTRSRDAHSEGVPDDSLHDDSVFTGPWAEEFKANYEKAKPGFVKDVLTDGQITDQEYAEMIARFTDCMGAVGITVKFREDGGMRTESPQSMTNDETHETSNRCSKEAGEDLIGSIWTFMHRNPERLDEYEIMTACLIREKVVAPDYSVDDFKRDYMDLDFTWTDVSRGEEVLVQCGNDPLDVFGE